MSDLSTLCDGGITFFSRVLKRENTIPEEIIMGVEDKSNHPPGSPEGGTWGTVKYVGSTTQMYACLGCLCFCLPGLSLLLCCCPQDKKDAYAVNGKVSERSLVAVT